MYVYLTELKELTSNLAKSKKDIEQFNVTYANVTFDVIYDISHLPFELLIGAKRYNWACILKIEKGFRTYMDDEDFYELCKILKLKPGKESLTSYKFLKFIANHAPKQCSKSLVSPLKLIYFRKHQINNSEADKIYFYGWNNHLKDKRIAHNFDKTELFFGKKVADYCRKNNISSLWSANPKDNINPTYPWDH